MTPVWVGWDKIYGRGCRLGRLHKSGSTKSPKGSVNFPPWGFQRERPRAQRRGRAPGKALSLGWRYGATGDSDWMAPS